MFGSNPETNCEITQKGENEWIVSCVIRQIWQQFGTVLQYKYFVPLFFDHHELVITTQLLSIIVATLRPPLHETGF
jgi:hypothetical protein